MKRLFVGLQIPENVQQTLQELPPDLMGAIWKSPEKYHLTLSFVGNVDEATAQ
jgi:2'-5' RNA ligase